MGLWDASVKEAKERLKASIIHIKYEFPRMKIVINLSPGDNKKSGVFFKQRPYLFDFQDVEGLDAIIESIVATAAGGHNLIMSGAPGKSMIAKRIPSILPSMTEKEALEVTKIYSVSGVLKNRGSLITERPFRAPHHNASLNALVGGGSNALPGEISLAHNGVLFLDEIAEFNKITLDALRQPMCSIGLIYKSMFNP